MTDLLEKFYNENFDSKEMPFELLSIEQKKHIEKSYSFTVFALSKMVDDLGLKILYNLGYIIGVFWIIEKITFLKIKEPYNKWYQIDKLNKLYSKVPRTTSGGGKYKNTFTNGK